MVLAAASAAATAAAVLLLGRRLPLPFTLSFRNGMTKPLPGI